MSNIYLKYLSYVVKHKWFVFVECCKLGIPIRGLFHDWSKFLPDEFIPYAEHFQGNIQKGRDGTGYYKAGSTGDNAFDRAWFLHTRRNKHHWQYWILPDEDEASMAVKMPLEICKEMVADWRGAGRAQGTPDTLAWYKAHQWDLDFHPETRSWIEKELGFKFPNVEETEEKTVKEAVIGE